MMNFLKKLFGIHPPKPVAPAPNTRAHRVSIHQSVNGEWFWHEQAANGEITCQSETFTNSTDAKRAALAHVAADRVFDDKSAL